MLPSDDAKAAKHKLLDLVKQADEQWERVFQLMVNAEEIADCSRMHALQKSKKEDQDREEHRRPPE